MRKDCVWLKPSAGSGAGNCFALGSIGWEIRAAVEGADWLVKGGRDAVESGFTLHGLGSFQQAGCWSACWSGAVGSTRGYMFRAVAMFGGTRCCVSVAEVVGSGGRRIGMVEATFAVGGGGLRLLRLKVHGCIVVVASLNQGTAHISQTVQQPDARNTKSWAGRRVMEAKRTMVLGSS